MEQSGFRRVKIVGTVGPASHSQDMLVSLIRAGLNVVRLNMSHADHDFHLGTIKNLRSACEETGQVVGLLVDLQGPKIRVGKFASDGLRVADGDEIQFVPSGAALNDRDVPSDYAELSQVVKTGDRILIDDGLIDFRVTGVQGERVLARAVTGGFIRSRKGINLPGVRLKGPTLTAKDLDDLEFGVRHGADFIALSFVRTVRDIDLLREWLNTRGSDARIIAKIEMTEALENLEAIVKASDGVMVARGDLAIETGAAKLTLLQKEIIRLSNLHQKPVITATQMLDSMVNNPTPTRAEITDVANAVLDGSDAVMLSAEMATGKYPRQCVSVLNDICREIETSGQLYYKMINESVERDFEAIAASSVWCARSLSAKVIVCLTTTGKTAQAIAALRPKAVVIAATASEATLNRLQLVWGIEPMRIPTFHTSEEAIESLVPKLKDKGLVVAGDLFVITLGYPVAHRAKTNALRIVRTP